MRSERHHAEPSYYRHSTKEKYLLRIDNNNNNNNNDNKKEGRIIIKYPILKQTEETKWGKGYKTE